MPCGAVYCSKSGKTGEEIKCQYIEQIKILQMCQACQQRCRSDSHIITSDQIQLCDSTCQNCIDLRSVCDPCQDLGHTSYIPSIRACTFCMENEQQCTCKVIFVLTLDCEEGNKKAMQMIKEAVEDATIDIHACFFQYATPFKNSFLFTCNGEHNLYSWSLDTKKTSVFAGSDSEGSRDGTAKHCQFYKPTGVAVELYHNIYVCDFRCN